MILMSFMKDNKRVCIVTGGNSGIGLNISEYLLKKSYKISILDINIDNFSEKLKEEIDAKNALVLKTDVTNFLEIRNSIEKIVEEFGVVTDLVNNAGILSSKSFFNETEKDWKTLIDVNLNGVFLCCKAVIPVMIKNRFGRIVNISSLSGLKNSIYSSTAYCASKAGIIGFSRSLASQTAKYNIRVNCVAPCTTESPMISSLDKEIIEDYIKNIPLGRIAKPSDVAHAVYFLLSDNSDFITGETINLSGGLLMR